jgi:ADP-heptose:LPS heptosyltransferase
MASDFNPRAFRTQKKLLLGRVSEVASPALRFASSLLSRGTKSEPGAWRNGLILSHNHIGDLLYRTCSLSQLRDALPKCRWTFLTTAQAAEVLHGNAALDSVLTYCTGENSWDLADGSFAALQAQHFDAALCTNTLRHYPDFLLAAALGIPNRVGFTYKGLSGLINHPVPIAFPNSFPGYFRAMVAHVTNQNPDWPLQPRLFLDAEHMDAADRVWSSLGFSSSRPVVACSLTTRQKVANWPPSLLLAILTQARRVAEFDVVITGDAKDVDDIKALTHGLAFQTHVLAGAFSIREFAAFLKKCKALLTLDSGARHVGNAVSTPVFFLHNPSVSQVETGRYCDNEIDLAPPVEYLSAEQISVASDSIDIPGAAASLTRCLSAAA